MATLTISNDESPYFCYAPLLQPVAVSEACCLASLYKCYSKLVLTKNTRITPTLSSVRSAMLTVEDAAVELISLYIGLFQLDIGKQLSRRELTSTYDCEGAENLYVHSTFPPLFLPPLLLHPYFLSDGPNPRTVNYSELNRDQAQLKIFPPLPVPNFELNEQRSVTVS
ncbi:hypothetical protein T07_183 [Trichinella nelsoni]|uniref:Uncharacterized protein n=1 Tax=Trichinella nelsoni TaxID=6336 RepID=A0A0V0S1D7_9BILA|nr:hypothetical protein T07_183 [Trichinella nelsoni]